MIANYYTYLPDPSILIGKMSFAEGRRNVQGDQEARVTTTASTTTATTTLSPLNIITHCIQLS